MERTHLGPTRTAPAPATAPVATAAPRAPVPLAAGPSLVVRRMTEEQAAPLRVDRAGYFDRIQTATERIPACFAVRGAEHPAIARLDELRLLLQNAEAAGAAAGVQQQLDELRPAVEAYEEFIAARADVLGDLDRLFTTFGAAGAHDPAMLAQVATALGGTSLTAATAKIGRDLRLGRGSLLELNDLRREVESTVMPTNKQMQDLRASNADHAAQVVSRLIRARLVRPGHLVDMWKAEGHDDGVDQFGAKWAMTAEGHHSGAGQWIRTWEYHIHGSAVRARPYQRDDAEPNPVTGFTIKRGHVKPTAKARVLGVSVQIQDRAFEAEVTSGESRDKFCRWANGKGAALLTSS